MDRLDDICGTENCSNKALKFYFRGGNKVTVCQLHLAGLTEDSFDIADIHLMEVSETALPRRRTRHEAFGEEDARRVREEKVRNEAALYAERAHKECAAKKYKEALNWWNKALKVLTRKFPTDKQTATAYLEQGWVLSQHLDMRVRAKKAFEQALDIVQRLHPSFEKVNIEEWLPRVLRASIECKDGEALLRRAMELGQEYYQDMSKVSTAMCFLGWISLKKQERQAEAETLLEFYFTSEDSLTSEGKALSCVLLAEVCLLNGNPYISEKKLKESLLIYEATSNSLAVAKTLSMLGDFYVDPMKLYEEAKLKYSASLQIYLVDSPASEVYAQTLCKLGDLYIKNMELYAAGEEMYQEAINILSVISPIRQADTLCRLAHLYSNNMDRYQSGEQKLKEAIDIYAVHSPTHMTEALVQLGEFYLRLMERYEDGDQTFQEAIERYRHIDPASTDLADTLFKLGDIFMNNRGQYRVGEQKLQAAMDIYATNDSPLVQADALCRIALLYTTPLHNYQAAEQAYKQAIHLYRVHDPTSKDLIKVLCSLGHFYVAIKQDTDGEEQYRAAIAIQAAKQSKSISYAKLLSSFGDLYNEMKRYEAAEQQYKEAIEIFRAIDPTSAILADQLCKLGALYAPLWPSRMDLRMKWYIDGEEKLKEALAIHSAHTPTSVQVADTLALLSEYYEGCVRCYAQAEKKYREVVAIHTAIGPTSLALADNLWKLGEFYCSTLYQYANAEQIFKQALEIYAAKRPTSRSYAHALSRLTAFYQYSMYLDEECEQAHKAAIEVYSANCPNSSELSIALRMLGSFYLVTQRDEEGKCKFQEAIEIYANLAPHSKREAEVLSILAEDYVSLQQYEAAEQKYREALAIDTLNGSISIYTANTMRQLGYLYLDELKKVEDGKSMCKAATETNRANNANHVTAATVKSRSFHRRFEERKEAFRLSQNLRLNTLDEAELISKLAEYYSSDSLQMYKRMIEIYTAKCPTSVTLADVLCQLGELYMSVDRNAEGQQMFEQAVGIHVAHSPRLSLSKMEGAQTAIDSIRRYKKPTLGKQRCIMSPAIGLLLTLCRRAVTYQYHLNGKPEQFYKEALERADSNDLLQSGILRKLGSFYGEISRYDEAEQMDKQAMQMWTSHYPSSLELADIQCSLAELYSCKMHRYEDAVQCYITAMHIHKANNSLRPLFKLARKLGELYASHMNKCTDSLMTLKRVLMECAVIKKNYFPDESLPVYALGFMYVQSRQYGDGEQKYIDAIKYNRYPSRPSFDDIRMLYRQVD